VERSDSISVGSQRLCDAAAARYYDNTANAGDKPDCDARAQFEQFDIGWWDRDSHVLIAERNVLLADLIAVNLDDRDGASQL
jgi:hypothetical protein